ncbi:MAG: ABC transporter substrate-binding protein [Brachymonas denitrificans]|uniref:MlaC/ttg2D family ABC transporter substrate-binding protein n=1 Tax=Brachymonas denitrificans TaxID=28220 RepID=UPI001BD13406|nr:ABC transporter substrate-binding protein [Brachymonas denitrificans]
MMMNRRTLTRIAGAAALAAAVATPSFAADLAPDAMVLKVSGETLAAIKADRALQGGDINKIIALVDSKVMPHVDFARMTASAVGPAWRNATPAQKGQLQQEFKRLLVRTYAGAFNSVGNREVKVLPMRAGSAGANDVVVRSQLVGSGDPVSLDYRLTRTPGKGLGWKAYNLNIGGVWMIDSYKQQFAQEVNTKGIDGLIATLAAKNKSNAAGK